MIVMGKVRAGSLPVRVFEAFNRMILRQANEVVMLDRFMVERVKRKGVPVEAKTIVLPPWSHESAVHDIPHADNPFRKAQGLGDKFVVMYSGNHSPANPLTTLLDAAERLQGDDRFLFMFIGGGGGKKEVADRIATGVKNIRSLPYQPLDTLRYSLSAADLHVVSIGNDVVGIVHPCKVYGAMAVSRPVLLLGPNPCHVSDLIAGNAFGWHVSHGDVDGACGVLKAGASAPREELRAMGRRAGELVQTGLSRDVLCRAFCDVLERGLNLGPAPSDSSQLRSSTSRKAAV
jgi:glycosyltransferase involved in cell wall biosynthesis